METNRPWNWRFVAVQLLSCVWLCDPMHPIACQASWSFSVSQNLLKLMSIESVMPSNRLILCHPIFPLPSIFPSIRVFSNESVLHIRWPKYWSFSFSISPSNDIQEWFPLGWTDLISLLSSELSRVFSSTAFQKQQFFSAQPSLWSISHICTQLPEKPQLWLYRPLSAKQCLCFLICCLGLS